METIQNDAEGIRKIMANFSKYYRQHPTLAREIIEIDALGTESNDYWNAWKDAVIDLACDASDQSYLLVLIKRAVAAFCSDIEGSRAVSILGDLAKIVPSSIEIIIKNFEASFPYWKNPQSTLQLKYFTRNALNLGSELPQLLERIIDFLTVKLLLIDLSIRMEDISFIFPPFEYSSENVKLLGDGPSTESPSSIHISGMGEKFCQEEKAREMEEVQMARQHHLDQCRDFANKLDLMLMMLFEFIQKSKISGNSREIGLLILVSFEKNVLNAAKPKFTQFLMFYAAATDYFVADRLLGSLLAGLFSRDAQLSLNAPKSMNNTQAKAKFIRSSSAFLLSFVKRSTSLSETQLNSINELLLEWIGRKVEALIHFPQNQTQIEISILANVVEPHFHILFSYSSVETLEDPRLTKAIDLAGHLFSSELRSIPIFEKLFQNLSPSLEESNKPNILPFNSFHLPLSRQFLLNSKTYRE